MQYTPVLNTGANWQIYNGPGFTGAVDIPKDVWFHLRVEVTGAQAKLYVKDLDKPALVMSDLKSGVGMPVAMTTRSARMLPPAVNTDTTASGLTAVSRAGLSPPA